MMPLGWALCFLGVVVLLIAALGLLRLPDALARQHAATKAGTLGLGLLILGAGLASGRWDWAPRVAKAARAAGRRSGESLVRAASLDETNVVLTTDG